MKSRMLQNATSTTTLPGAPDGEYVVFQFNASFEYKSAAVETVTAILREGRNVARWWVFHQVTLANGRWPRRRLRKKPANGF
jgi:hypothetical protein